MARLTEAAVAEGRWLILGDTAVARRLLQLGQSAGQRVIICPEPTEHALSAWAATGVDAVAVVLHDDVATLRCALLAARQWPDATIVATVFDQTIGTELQRLLPRCHVQSPGDVAAPVLAARCLHPGSAWLASVDGHCESTSVLGSLVLRGTWARSGGMNRRWLWNQLRRFSWNKTSSARLIVIGIAGLCVVLIGEAVGRVAEGSSVSRAFFEACQLIATVGPGASSPHGAAALAASGIGILVAVVFTAFLTAGLVDLLLGPRLVALVGSRTLPRAQHVIVVGLGQVGFRLCVALRAMRVPVLAIERDVGSIGVRHARAAGIPVLIGDGTDRAVLHRASVGHAIALAAVASDDSENLAVAIAAGAQVGKAELVMRMGDNPDFVDASLLGPLGQVVDVVGLSVAYIWGKLNCLPFVRALATNQTVWLVDEANHVVAVVRSQSAGLDDGAEVVGGRRGARP